MFLKGNLDGALAKYQEIIAAKPKSPDAYAGMIRVYLKKKDVTQADETAKKALQAADSAPVRVAYGEVLFREGRIPDAEKEWVNVINSGRQIARAYYGLARVRAAISMYQSAWTMIEKAHAIDPTDPEITNWWVSKLSREERIKYYEDYLAGKNNEDEEHRAYLRHYLDYLKARRRDTRICKLVTKMDATETPLSRMLRDAQHLRGFGLPVFVNGEQTRLLLDTGASGIMINQKFAEKAGVTRISDTEVSGFGDQGRKGAYVGLANSLKIGDLEFKDCTVRVMEQNSIVGLDGLVGADVFSGFLVDLDFANEKLRLSQLPKRPGETDSAIKLHTDTTEESSSQEEGRSADQGKDTLTSKSAPNTPRFQDRYIAPEMKSYTQVLRFGHGLLVPTMVSTTPGKLFLLDTGSLSNLISPAAAREVTKVRGDTHITAKGVSGTVSKVYTADRAVLQFGHLKQENQDLISFDLSHTSDNFGTEVSGVLGFTLLRLLDVKIDYRDGLVDFNYDPNRWKFLQ